MSKAFTKDDDDDDGQDPAEIPVENTKNYVTPHGFDLLQNEYKSLLADERPKVVAVVKWAAGNGDRSENGDYIYGKKRLREIDRRIRYLTKRLESAEIIKPELQQHLSKVFFGASVTYKHLKGRKETVKIVGVDEANYIEGKISWISPVAKSLLKSEVGDRVLLQTPEGKVEVEITAIKY